MRQLVLTRARALALRHVPDPAPGHGEVRVAVHAAGICGSDLHGYRGENNRRPRGVVMGHEVSGTVEAVGPGVAPECLGRAVAVNPLQSCGDCDECSAGRENLCSAKVVIGCGSGPPGGFADYLIVPARSVHPWPGHLPLEWAALAEPFAVGLHAADLAAPAGLTVNVIGGGVVALSVALAAHRRGAARVVVAALEGRRREVIAGFGMQTVRPGRGSLAAAHVTFDCVASPATVGESLEATRPGGTVVVVGFGSTHSSLPMTPLVHGERVVRGSAQYPDATFSRAVEWLSEDRLDLNPALSRPYGLPEGPDVFRRLSSGKSASLRTVIAPQADVSP